MALNRDLDGYRDVSHEYTREEQIARAGAARREEFLGTLLPDNEEDMWLGSVAHRFLTGVTTAAENFRLGREIRNRAEEEVRNWSLLALERGLDDNQVREGYISAKAWSQLLGFLGELIDRGAEVKARQDGEWIQDQPQEGA